MNMIHWTVDPEQIWKKSRRPGISGFLRVKNEAEFLDRAIETHISGLDELVIVYNDCADNTPDICQRWARKMPEKIKVVEYEPRVVPFGTPESFTIDPRSPNCIANYYNFALALTNHQIVIKIDGDHHAVAWRFRHICAQVRKRLLRSERYPIFGLNLTIDHGEIVIYNFYDYHPSFTVEGADRIGPPAFSGGDHAFYYVDASSWHTVDPIYGYEWIELNPRTRSPYCLNTYCYFHLKGFKDDRGTGNWGYTGQAGHVRKNWISGVLAADQTHLCSVEAMRRHNPLYFRGVRVERELRRAFPAIPVRRAQGEEMPRLGLRDHLANAWYWANYAVNRT